MTISPTNIRDYARSRGWIVNPEGFRDRLYVLNNPAYERRQLVFPMDTDVADYEETVASIAEKLAYFEGVTVEHLIGNLLEVRDDILRVRITSGREGVESLPLTFATSAVTATQQLLLSAACTVLQPRVHHPRLFRTQALQFLDAAQFQHTEHGSFVLKVSCPFDALDLGDDAVPFARQTMLTLNRALHELVGAIETDRLSEYIDTARRAEAPVVSSNFCEALTRLQDETLRNSLEVGVSWSPLNPVLDAVRYEPLRIQQDYFPRIEEVRRALRDTGLPIDDTFIGTVEQLNGDMDEAGHRAGEVMVALLLSEGEVVRANTNLTAEQYAIADKAHMTEGAYVVIRGRLHQGRQPRLLTNVTGFEIVHPGLPEIRVVLDDVDMHGGELPE